MCWWWPFGKKREEADSEFRNRLREAAVSQEDLRRAIEELRAERERRIGSRPTQPLSSYPEINVE